MRKNPPFCEFWAGLLKPDEGEVLVDGKKVEKPERSRCMVFQDYALFPWMNVWNNIAPGPEGGKG